MIYELLVRVRDKDKGVSLKRGDVVWAHPAGHVWGREELSNPDWQIIKVEATEEQINDLLVSATNEAGEITLKRAKNLDLDSLGIATAKVRESSTVEADRLKVTIAVAQEIKTKPKPKEQSLNDEVIDETAKPE